MKEQDNKIQVLCIIEGLYHLRMKYFSHNYDSKLRLLVYAGLIVLIGLLSQSVLLSGGFIMLIFVVLGLIFFFYNPFLILGLLMPIESLYVIPLEVTKLAKILLLLLMVLILFYKYSDRLSEAKHRPRYLNVMILFSTFGIISSVLSDSIFQSSLKVFQYVVIFLTYYYLAKIKFSEAEIKKIINYFLFGMFLSACIGVLQYFTDMNWLWSQTVKESSTGTSRVTAFFNNTNGYGGYLFIGLALIIGNWIWGKKCFKVLLIQIPLFLLLCINFIWTESEGSMIGLMIAIVILLIEKLTSLKKLIVIFSPFIILMLLLGLGFIDDTFLEFFKRVLSEQGRLFLWQGALQIFSDNWINGIGFYSFYETLNEYGIYSLYGSKWPHPHNLFLDLIVTLGLSGIIIYSMLLFNLIRSIYSLNKSKIAKHQYGIVILAIMIGAFMHDFIDGGFFWGTSSCATLLWILIGIIED
ncbi:O-antigen ligase family protein [Bacillus paranthracis]|uniref:O-antigen ligase family protein n=1 Tax=Bacillus paranthracis TaxID=2026186 RepID=UPI0007783FEE|nr:O-antigen ligase family protein [Bacillus paranthracis]KXY05760.1 hypothetical protein AT271_08985 [Bacillus cereus]MCC2440075.1 O-antigen ligase family protein [Bacillus paranthracis]MDG1601609.1 O-antigen ligase family protein [Bacillus paranthracis]